MAIVIKKRVSLEFIGDDYKDSYIVFKALAIKEYADLQSKAKALEEDPEKSLEFIINTVKDRFIEGSVEGKDITADDLTDFPGDVFLEFFNNIRGQLDPKA